MAVHARSAPSAPRRGGLPLPREHGVWFMLYVPALLGVASGPRPNSWGAFCFILSLTFFFLAREPLVRPREAPRALAPALAAAGMAAGVPLLLDLSRALPLLALFGAGAALQGYLLWHARRRPRRRFDRTGSGQALGALCLALAAPAGRLAAGGGMDARGLILWLASALFFVSGVAYVHTLLAALRAQSRADAEAHAAVQRQARATAGFHVALAAALLGVCSLEGRSVWLPAVGFLPTVWRGIGVGRVARGPIPSLRRVGMLEGVRAMWYLMLWLAALNIFP